jgi:N-glycosylase/DNA lyase
MSGFSPEDAMDMEKRHILEGEQRVARQEALIEKLREQGRDQFVRRASQVLDVLRESLELSRERLRDLEHRYHSTPGGKAE